MLRGLLKEAEGIGHTQDPFGADKALLLHPFQEAAEVFRRHRDDTGKFLLFYRQLRVDRARRRGRSLLFCKVSQDTPQL